MANEEHLKILEQGIDVWNEWRRNNPQITPDLSNSNLEKFDLESADFSSTNLSRVEICNSNLKKVIFRNADLQKATLFNVILCETDFFEANLEEADLGESGIKINDSQDGRICNIESGKWIANFRKSNLQKANLIGTKLDGVDFSEANLTNVQIHNASLNKTNFSNANLSGVNFSKFDYIDELGIKYRLGEDNLCSANLSEAKFINTNLSYANFISVHFNGENLKGANFNGSNLFGADLRWSNFKKIKLFKVNFKEAILIEANLNQARFEKVNFEKSNLSKADLCDAKFINSNLKCSNFSEALIRNVTIIKSNLKGANFTYADLSDSLLKSVLLTGACLYRSSISFWKIKNVKCKYIYLDSQRKSRYPKDRNFEPIEFERLYRTIPTIEFVFDKGMKWIDALILDWITNKMYTEKPELGLELLSLDKKGVYPKATFAVSSKELKEEAEKEIKSHYEEAIQVLESQNQRHLIDRLFDLSMYALQQPRKQIRVAGDYYEIHGNAQINKIKINQAIEDIKQEVEKEPETSFKGKTKKKVIEILDDTLKDVAKGGLKEAGKKIFELAQTELVSLLPKIATQLGVLKMINF